MFECRWCFKTFPIFYLQLRIDTVLSYYVYIKFAGFLPVGMSVWRGKFNVAILIVRRKKWSWERYGSINIWLSARQYLYSRPVIIKLFDNLQQTCYYQAGASDANPSWYRFDDRKVTSLQQTWCNLRVSGLCDVLQFISSSIISYHISSLTWVKSSFVSHSNSE